MAQLRAGDGELAKRKTAEEEVEELKKGRKAADSIACVLSHHPTLVLHLHSKP